MTKIISGSLYFEALNMNGSMLEFRPPSQHTLVTLFSLPNSAEPLSTVYLVSNILPLKEWPLPSVQDVRAQCRKQHLLKEILNRLKTLIFFQTRINKCMFLRFQ